MARRSSRNLPFLYSKPEDFDPLRREYEVIEAATQRWVGAVREEDANHWQVERPQDEGFHGAFGSRREAALWLRDHMDDPAIFDQET